MNHFSILLWHVTKSGFFFMTTGDDQLSGWTQKKLQSTSQKQTWTTEKGHDNSLVVYCWSDPCQLSESWGNYCIWEVCSANWEMHQNCNACSQHWSTERAQFFFTTPDYISHNKRFKSWTKWATKFYLILHFHLTSHQPATTSSSILTTFCRKMLPQLAGGRQCFLRVHWILKHGFLCYRNEATYFSLAKICWLLLFPL